MIISVLFMACDKEWSRPLGWKLFHSSLTFSAVCVCHCLLLLLSNPYGNNSCRPWFWHKVYFTWGSRAFKWQWHKSSPIGLIVPRHVPQPWQILTVCSSTLWCDADVSGLGRWTLRRGCTAAPRRILLSTGLHQLPNQNPLQAAVVHALTEPSTTWEPAGKDHVSFLSANLWCLILTNTRAVCCGRWTGYKSRVINLDVTHSDIFTIYVHIFSVPHYLVPLRRYFVPVIH